MLLLAPVTWNLTPDLSVVIAERFHPFSFRTRQLSSPAPMVLHGQLCGRVGRRRFSLYKTPVSINVRRGFCFVVPGRSGGSTRSILNTAVIPALFRADMTPAPASLASVAYRCIAPLTASWFRRHLNSKMNRERSAAPMVCMGNCVGE